MASYWPDNLSNLSTLWYWGGDGWTFTSIMPKVDSRTESVSIISVTALTSRMYFRITWIWLNSSSLQCICFPYRHCLTGSTTTAAKRYEDVQPAFSNRSEELWLRIHLAAADSSILPKWPNRKSIRHPFFLIEVSGGWSVIHHTSQLDTYIKDPPKTPLVQCINLTGGCFW